MEYILIIWIYSQNRVIEIDYLDLDTCLAYEVKASQWPGSPITACQKKPPVVKLRAKLGETEWGITY